MKCRNAKPQEKPYKLADGDRMYLLVNPNGSKLWRMNYVFDGKQKTLSFGKYPYVNLAEARDLRLAAKAKLAKGIDPAIKETQVETVTFKSVAERWLTGQELRLDPEYVALIKRRFEANVYPEFKDRDIRTITSVDVLTIIRKIEDKGSLEVARRTRQHIGAVLGYAVAESLVERDVSLDIRKALRPRLKVVNRASIHPTQLPEFFERLNAYGGTETVKLGIKAILHTFVRTSELRFATWSEFDWRNDLWRIPPERMKMDREHVVPLTRQSRKIFERLLELAGDSPMVINAFPGKPFSENAMLYALYHMGYNGRLTIHGLRGTASTALYESTLFQGDWIEMQLAHVEGNKVKSAYNSAEYLKPRREMMQWWSDFLDAKELESIA